MKQELKNMMKYYSFILTKKQKIQSFFIVIIIIIGAGLETVGISAIIPFLGAMLEPEIILENKIFLLITSFFRINNSSSVVLLMGIVLILVYIFKNIYLIISSYIQIRFRWRMQKNLAVCILNSYLSRPYTYFLNINSSEVLRGINDDVHSTFTLLEYIFKFISDFLTILLICIFLCITDFEMAIGVVIIVTSCLLTVSAVFRRQLKGVGQKQRNAAALQNKYAYQAVNGIKEINVMQRKQFFTQKYDEAYEESFRSMTKFNFLSKCPDRIIEAVCICGIIGILCIKDALVGNLESSIIALGAFAMAAFRILPLIGQVIAQLNALVYYKPGLKATYDNLHEVEEYEKEKQEYINKYAGSVKEYDGNINFKKSVSVQHVNWKYPNSEKYVLKDLSLSIVKGESIAFIGESGAGKTTLADMILGLLPPEKGKIIMDGIDVYSMPMQWSKIIGFVPQFVFLTDDTIKANVTLGLNEAEIKEHLVWKALEQAQLKKFIERLPNGLDTIVGERGIKFSGGQRQRIAIARALYYNPEILVLDEATSALDNETELAVMESIDSLQKSKTLIIVAHRLTTIKNCDKIYEIANGQAILRSKEEIFS